MRSQYVYLPIDAVVSLVANTGGLKANGEPHPDVTLSVLGAGDLVGVAHMFGDAPSACTAIVDIGGSVLRASAQAVRRLLDREEESRRLVSGYANLTTAESWQWTAASVQLPNVVRVAAYLLVYRQLSNDDQLPITHLSMSRRMAMRKASVTESMAELTEAGIATSVDRGRIHVKDAFRLRQLVLEAWPLYGTHRQAFRDAWDLDEA